MTTTPEAKRLVVAAVGAAALLAAVADFGRDRPLPRLRIAIGAVIAGTVLALGAEFVPELVGPFAALVLLTALLTTAPDVWRRIQNAPSAADRKRSETQGSAYKPTTQPEVSYA